MAAVSIALLAILYRLLSSLMQGSGYSGFCEFVWKIKLARVAAVKTIGVFT